MQTTHAPTYTHAGARNGLTRDEVMTAIEVADLLGIPVSTVYYLARQGQLPHSRLGRTYRFLRPQLEREVLHWDGN
jgi:excisionase family DNA binding protein